MKFLLCHNRYQQTGGEDRAFDDDVWLLKKNGHEVATFVVDNRDIDSSSGKVGLALGTLWNRKAHRKISRVITEFAPDLIHFNNTFQQMSPSVHAAAQAAGIPVIQSLHNYRLHCANALLYRDNNICEDCLGRRAAWFGIPGKCYRNSAAASAVVVGLQLIQGTVRRRRDPVTTYIVPTAFARDKSIQAGLPAGQLAVRGSFVRAQPQSSDRPGQYALFVGRLTDEKGINLLLETWSGMDQSIPLKIIGDGPLAEVVARACERDNRINWHGHQSSRAVMDFMAAASFLVMPSTWYETFGRTMIEAFSCRVPVIASSLGAMKEIVGHEQTGLLFDPGSVSGLTNCVLRLVDDEKFRATLGDRAFAEYQQKYTHEANYRQLMRIYDNAIQSNRTDFSTLE